MSQTTFDAEIIRSSPANTGETLDELSHASPVLVVFLRHGGCPFCRETLAKIAESRARIEAAGTRVVLVHMLPDEQAPAFFQRYGLADLPRISDADRKLYAEFDLQRGSLAQVMGPRTWWRGFVATILSGHLVSRPIGDVMQLPGAFLIHRGQIIKAFRPQNSAAQPNFDEMATCELA